MMRPRRLAFFVTPHGFGHASRAVAVVESLVVHDPQLEFIFVTSVPKLIFFSSASRFDYHLLECDVGLVQRDALTTDLPATLQKLTSFLPFDTDFVESLAFQLLDWGCCAVISDIAPLGIEAARVAGLPSILIENFTWDWIYRGYADRYPEMTEHADYLTSIYAAADLHLQCQPACRPTLGAIATTPVSRKNREDAEIVRDRLGAQHGRKLVLITMGGTPHHLPFLQALGHRWSDVYFLIAGPTKLPSLPENVQQLSSDSFVHHPDLVRAADAVIGKVGYSTIAEVYRAGVPFGYFSPPGNPETPALLAFLNTHIQGIHFEANAYANGSWLDQLPDLLTMSKVDRSGEEYGADQCAASIVSLVDKTNWR